MRLIIQRVKKASVAVDGQVISSIDQGYLIFLGIGEGDTKAEAEKLWQKTLKLRIFSDSEGKTNLSLADLSASVLIVSQFTLYADCKKGNRPSFTKAAKPDLAQELYLYFLALAQKDLAKVQAGKFAATMEVALVNDGPFTIILDSALL